MNKKIIYISTLLLAIVFIPLAINQFKQSQDIRQNAQTANNQLYVTATGSGSSCTQSAPCREISTAQSVATAGTIVNVGPGTYAAVAFTKSGGDGQPIRYISTEKWGAIIAAGGSITANNISIENFEISGPTEAFGWDVTGNNITIKGNKIHNIHKFAPTSNGGAAMEVFTANYEGSLTGISIDGNVIFDIGQSVGGSQLVQGIYVDIPCAGCTITNNLIYQIEDFGIHSYHNPDGWIVANNTVFNNGRGILTGPNFITINNASFSNLSSNFDDRGSTVFSNNLEVDPGVVNYKPDGTGDYHLKSGGPGVDKGIATNAPTTDIDGNTRPQGAAVDIGAYEFVSNTTVQPTTANPTLATPTNVTPTLYCLGACPTSPADPTPTDGDPSISPTEVISVAPTVAISPTSSTIAPSPTPDPCDSGSMNSVMHKKKHKKGGGGFIEMFFQFFMKFLELFMQLIGMQPPSPSPTPDPAPDPCPEPTQAPQPTAVPQPTAQPTQAATPTVFNQPTTAVSPTTAPIGGTAPDSSNCAVTAAETLGWGNATYESHFNTATLDPRWHPYGPEPGHNKAGTRTPAQITLANGEVTLAGKADGTTAAMSWYPGQRYGRWEACVKSDAGSGGLNSVMLLWPDAEDFPVGGEIDFMEISDKTRQNTDFFLHYGSNNSQVHGSVKADATQWNAWALEWTPTKVTAYLNGKEFYSTTNTSILPPRPMHLCLQLDYFAPAGGPTATHIDWTKQWAIPESQPSTLGLKPGEPATGQPGTYPDRKPRPLTIQEMLQ